MDSVLVVVETQRSPFVRLYNVKDGRKIGSFIPAGRGPDELSACTQFQITGDWIWAIDMLQNKYLKYRRKDPFWASFEKPVLNAILRDVSISYPIIIDSNIIAGSDFSVGKLLFFYDLEKKEIDANVNISYPYAIDGPDMLKWRSFENRMTTDSNHLYLAYCHTDLIDIYDKTGSLVKRLFGPDHFMPDFGVTGTDEQGFMVRPGEKARFAYFSPKITDDGLMVLYNGTLQKERKYLVNQIFLFSPSGEPLVAFYLDQPIFNFCVDDVTKRIYGLTNTPDYQVICFDYGEYL